MQRKHVIGPNGRRLTVSDLPSPDTKRWVVRRKAEVVAAVEGGLLSMEEACSRYALTFDEFRSWQRFIDCFGIAGLRTTRTTYYRNRQLAQVEAARLLTVMTSALRNPPSFCRESSEVAPQCIAAKENVACYRANHR
jgi:hypothetical protein